MIELNDFIAEALTSIVKGIQQGQKSDVGDHIAPLIQGEKRNEYGNFHLKDDQSNRATIVQIDVQVATEVQTETQAGEKENFAFMVLTLKSGVAKWAQANRPTYTGYNFPSQSKSHAPHPH